MVLTRPAGGAGAAGAPRAGGVRRARGEAGSQALEFALVLPAVVLVLVVLLHAALVGVDLVIAQGLAREAARTAAVDGDEVVESRLDDAAGDRPVELELSPPESRRSAGQVVTVELRVRSRGFAAFGAEVWVPARAAMRVETP